VGELEGRSGKLSRRAKRLEEEAAADERARQAAAERDLRDGLALASTAEPEAMGDYLDRAGREEWGPGDEPIMLRLLELKGQARRER
jgi:hypothetical protein